jgi:hypothetical protein
MRNGDGQDAAMAIQSMDGSDRITTRATASMATRTTVIRTDIDSPGHNDTLLRVSGQLVFE